MAVPIHCGREEHDPSYVEIAPEQEDDDFNATPSSLAASAVLSLNPKVILLQRFFCERALTMFSEH